MVPDGLRAGAGPHHPGRPPARRAHRLGEPRRRRAGPPPRTSSRRSPPTSLHRVVDVDPRRPARGRRHGAAESVRAITEVVSAVRTGSAAGHAVTHPSARPPTTDHPPEELRCPTPPAHHARRPHTEAGRARTQEVLGPARPSPWPPRSWSSSTSPSSTPPCPSIGQLPATSTAASLQWLVTAYLMMSGGGLLLGGRIADLLSRRGVFLTGLALFTVASLVSGFADSGSQLIAARAVQGLSAALLTPSALVADHDHLRRRRSARPRSPCGARSAASASPPASSSAAPSPPGPAGSPSSGSTSPSASSPCSSGTASSPSRRVDPPQPGATSTCPAPSPSSPASPPSSTPSAAPRPTAGGRSGPWPRSASRPSCWWSFLKLEQRARQAAVPPARLEAPSPGLRHRRHARRHRHPGRRRLPDLDLPADRARLLRPARPGSRSCRSRSPSPSAPWSPATCWTTSPRAASRPPGCVITVAAAALLSTATSGVALRHRPASRPGRARTRRRHGLRARLGDLDGRHPRLARRRGLRLPDDRPRGRRRAGRRRPVRGRQHAPAP